MRRRWLAAGAAGAVVIAGGAIATVSGGADEETASAASQATRTAEISRRDLVESEEIDGTLGHADERAVINRRSGTLTWVPEEGATVPTNRRLYEVDGEPVFLLDGTYPAYRALQSGTEGRDVRQLERNLRALGHDPDREMDVDGAWDAGTTAAVERWQDRKGVPVTGTVALGDVVFLPGDRRVASVDAAAGADAPAATSASTSAAAGAEGGGGAQLMTTTATRRVVTVDLEVSKRDLAARGDRVDVELPSGRDVPGTITRVGRVAEVETAGQEDDPPATVEVTIRLRRAAGSGLDRAPVDVAFEKERAKDVLTVPVTALLAQRGGGLAVELREGDARRVVPVETGLATDDAVEVEGEGLEAGMRVTDAGV